MTHVYRNPAAVSKSKYIAKRRETIQEIWRALEKYCVVLVRGTPCSGKSTLGYLVARHARKKLKEPYETVLVPIWYPRLGETATEILRDACAKQLPGRKFGEGISQRRVLFIIDEAQTTYSNLDLWNILLKNAQTITPRPSFSYLHAMVAPESGRSTSLRFFHGTLVQPSRYFCARHLFRTIWMSPYPSISQSLPMPSASTSTSTTNFA